MLQKHGFGTASLNNVLDTHFSIVITVSLGEKKTQTREFRF